jgi:arsenite methyltransferase
MEIGASDVATNYDELPLWSAPFGQLILDRVPLKRGQTALDIGAGTGFLTIELAQRSGDDSRVIAVDPWAEAMAVLQRKVDFLGLSNVELSTSDAAKLDLPDDSVDVVVSNLGVNNFDNADTVLRECRRVLRPSGRMLISTNLMGHMAEFYDAYRDVLNALDLRQHLDALESHIAHRATVDGTLAMFASAGFADTQVHTGSFRLRYADGTALLRHYFIGLGFLPAWRAIVPPEDAQRVLDAVERELNRRAAETGDLALTIPMACFSAQKKAQ